MKKNHLGTITIGSKLGVVIYHHPWKWDGDDDDANDGVSDGDRFGVTGSAVGGGGTGSVVGGGGTGG